MAPHSVTVPVWLGKRKKLLKGGKTVTYWQLRWPATGITANGGAKYHYDSLGQCTRGEAEEARRKKIADLDSGAAPIDKPGKITLSAFTDLYLQRRSRGSKDDHTAGRWLKKYPKLAGTTITNHRMTLRYLVEHFGPTRPMESITALDITVFLDALEAGKLEGARKKSKQTYALNGESVKSHLRNAKTVFSWAVTLKIISHNPLAGFSGKSGRSAPKHHVSLDELERLILFSPDDGWRAMFALCRLAGLRRGEAQALPWDGEATDRDGVTQPFGVVLDGKDSRLHVVAAKTHTHRAVPIVPQLQAILCETSRSRSTVTGLSPNNLLRDAHVIAKDAGIEPWPNFFQAMRTSCENAWKERGIAEATYAAWIGHGLEVSRKHYVSPTDTEYESVTREA